MRICAEEQRERSHSDVISCRDEGALSHLPVQLMWGSGNWDEGRDSRGRIQWKVQLDWGANKPLPYIGKGKGCRSHWRMKNVVKKESAKVATDAVQ